MCWVWDWKGTLMCFVNGNLSEGQMGDSWNPSDGNALSSHMKQMSVTCPTTSPFIDSSTVISYV
jgi:hypothetical protein